MQSNIGSMFWAAMGAIGGLLAAAVYFGVVLGAIDLVLGGKTMSDAYAQSLGYKVAYLAMGVGVPVGSIGAVVLLEKTAGFGRVFLGFLVAVALSGFALLAFFNSGGLKVFNHQGALMVFAIMGFVAVLGFVGRSMKSAAA